MIGWISHEGLLELMLRFCMELAFWEAFYMIQGELGW